MARTRLTDALVKALPAPERGNKIHYDALVPGFGIRVTAAGARAWVVAYAAPDGRERRMTIGSPADGWRVGMAREEARRIRRLADQGKDPLAEREEARAAPTVADAVERYRLEHLPRKRPASQRDDERMLAKDVLPRLGRLRVADVRPADVDRMHREIASRGAAYGANRAAALLSKLFALCIRWGWRTDNPAKGVERAPEEPRARYLSPAELERLSSVLASWPNQDVAATVRLLLLTGARRGEVLSMAWADLDLAGGTWTKPSAATKQKREHRLPLNQAAIEVLRVIPQRGPWVFPGRHGGHVQDIKKSWHAIAKAAGLSDVRLHDLRHSFASILAGQGLGLPIIGQLLGHTQAATTARYAHLSDAALREATERAGAVVVPLRRAVPD